MPRGRVIVSGRVATQGRVATAGREITSVGPDNFAGMLWRIRADVVNMSFATGVLQWNDISNSGGNLHVANAVGASQPTFLPAALNGRGAVQFNGTSHLLRRTNTTLGIGTAAYTIAMVSKDDAGTPNGAILDVSDGASGIGVWQRSSNRSIRHLGVSNGDDGAFQTSTYEYKTITFTTGSAPVFRVNGVAQSLTTAPTTLVAPPGNATLAVGGRLTGVDFWAACRVAEIIVYSRALSTGEITALELYMKARYGL